MRSFSDFINDAPIYRKFEHNSEAIHIFEKILSKEENIIAMIDTSESGKPALAVCLEEVEQYYLSQSTPQFDLQNDFAKRALGAMVRVILEEFGYLKKGQKDIPKRYNSRFVTSATTYELTGVPSMKVVKRIEKV